MPAPRFPAWFALLGGALFAAISFALGWVYAALPPLPPTPEALMLSLPAALFAAVALALPRGVLGPLGPDDMPLMRRPRLWAVVVGMFIAISLAVALWESLSPLAEQAAQTVTDGLNLGQNPLADGLIILAVTLAAPLGEELFFRGLIHRSLRDGLLRRTPKWLAVAVATVLSSLAFALAHTAPGQEHQIWMICLMGMGMALSYEMTGTLLAPIMIHTLNNSLAALQNFWIATPGTMSHDGLLALVALSPVLAYLLARRLGQMLGGPLGGSVTR